MKTKNRKSEIINRQCNAVPQPRRVPMVNMQYLRGVDAPLFPTMKDRLETALQLSCKIVSMVLLVGALAVAAEFGLSSQESYRNNLESRIASPNAHTCTDTLTSDRYAAPAPQCSNAGLFHAPPKLPQRDGTLQSVFHTVPAPWRENAGLFSRPKSGSRASANSADIHQNVPENGSGTVAHQRRAF